MPHAISILYTFDCRTIVTGYTLSYEYLGLFQLFIRASIVSIFGCSHFSHTSRLACQTYKLPFAPSSIHKKFALINTHITICRAITHTISLHTQHSRAVQH